jgi:hypothetical protein
MALEDSSSGFKGASQAKALIRKLTRQLTELREQKPVGLTQGLVTEVNGSNLTIIASGGTNPITGWKYLLDAYTPTEGDVVWILDGGPASKIVLGPTQRS